MSWSVNIVRENFAKGAVEINMGLFRAIQTGQPIAAVDCSNEYAELLADMLAGRDVLPRPDRGFIDPDEDNSVPAPAVSLGDALSKLAGDLGEEETDLDAEELPEGGAPSRVSTLRTINRREEQALEELRDIVAGAAGVDVGSAA